MFFSVEYHLSLVKLHGLLSIFKINTYKYNIKFFKKKIK